MLKINVGLSRKVTEDYNSRGFSLNIEGELPSDVLQDERSLRSATDRLFQIANLMLDEQVRKGAASASQPAAEAGNGHFNTYSGQSRQNGRSYSNGSGQGRSNDRSNRSGGGGRTLTQAQGRAITNMARKLNVDAGQWAYDQFGCAVGQLTVKQASEAINRLKEQIDHEGVSR